MNQAKIDIFLMSNGSKFSPTRLEQIINCLTEADDNLFQNLLLLDIKDPMSMLLISLMAGPLGIDRFMLGESGLGIAKLLTAGGCGIWTIIDWFTIMDKTKEYNFNQFMLLMNRNITYK